jgi:hypothetical protein
MRRTSTHCRVGQAEYMGDDLLQFARMLGRGENIDVVLARNRERDLAFEIEVLLPANVEHAVDPPGCGGEHGGAIAFAESVVG